MYGNVHIRGPWSRYNIHDIRILSDLSGMSKRAYTVPEILIYDDDAALTALKLGKSPTDFVIIVLEMLGKRLGGILVRVLVLGWVRIG